MDKDIMKYLIMFKLRFGDEPIDHSAAVEFKRVVFPQGYRTDMVKGLVSYLHNRDVKLLTLSREGQDVKLSPKALKLIEENENGI